ncbi:uncharacterized protein DNG_09918 [Cephalotrichum gorgonifer]|uniref:Uncharacterized protein n=1 Tax=Cephalotrichum gorgonifer TaxID=2041049 RepID=A0AAE8N7N7_9PEZI|nr:uncharacterized protein DNG_09918 [Cephalotrichum gorgonifer]
MYASNPSDTKGLLRSCGSTFFHISPIRPDAPYILNLPADISPYLLGVLSPATPKNIPVIAIGMESGFSAISYTPQGRAAADLDGE